MLDDIIGQSAFSQRIQRILHSLAGGADPLILAGEPGVGKTFLAAHLHRRGKAAAHDMEVLNFSIASDRAQRLGLLGAEPPELSTTKRGVLELPTTVVLKHVDHANQFLQDNLARALQSRTTVRLGSQKLLSVRARIVLTFRKSIGEKKREGRISDRLYEVLQNVRIVHIPPLRERPDDIPPLAAFYFRKFHNRVLSMLNGEAGTIPGDKRLDPSLIEQLQRHRWNDNVRDLMAFVRGLLAFPFDEEIQQPEKLEVMKMLTNLEEGREFSLESSMSIIRHSMISRAARMNAGHQRKTAELLGLSDREIRRSLSV